MLRIFVIAVLFIAASLAQERRYFPNQGSPKTCFSRNRKQGECVPLKNCESLKDIADQVPRMFILSAVSEYICGYDDIGVQVCCPVEGRENQPAPRPPPPKRPQQTRPRPRPTTEAPQNWPAVVRPEKIQDTPAGPSVVTTHRNRRLLPKECGIELGNKILGGNETGLEEYPWMALLRLNINRRRTVYTCGGALISPRYVLTAAHCIKNSQLPVSSLIDQVRLGEHDVNSEYDCQGSTCSTKPVDVEIEERIVHKNYNMRDPSSRNDIALLRLKQPVTFSSYIQPICLPLDDLSVNDFVGSEMWTAGWGRTTNTANSQSPVKQKVLLPIVPINQCVPIYRSQSVEITDKQICAGGESGKDSCRGDSGGPLMRQDVVGSTVRWHIQGVVSFGPEMCGKANNPGIYTRVSKYLDWILENMRE